DKITSFLYRSVFTRSMNILKHRKVTEAYIEKMGLVNEMRMAYMETVNDNGLHRLENEELKQLIDSAVNSLPDKCRNVFRMSYLYQMSNAEIAETMEISVRTVEAHMYKALKELRGKLGKSIFFVLFLLWL
ncbi:MAG TPA: sigma-70 family RNA polymerase sigma factor, partial [Prevotella sp.]